MKHPIVVGSCLVLAALIVGLAVFFKPVDPACIRLEAKVNLAQDFCGGLSERAAQERCSALADDPETMGQCMRVIVPAAHSSCMSYLNAEAHKRQYEAVCE